MLNNCTYIGRLTKDVELRGEKQNVASSTIAVNRSWKKEGDPDADFFKVTVLGEKRATSFASFCRKGSLIAVTGETHINSYKNAQGVDVYYGEIIVSNYRNLEKRSSDNQPANSATNSATAQTPVQNSGFQAASSPFAPLPPENKMPWDE